MKRLSLFVFAAIVAFMTSAVAAQDAPQRAHLGAPVGVLELKPYLRPYTPPSSAAHKNNSSWYTFAAENLGSRSTTRVLQAGQPPSSGLSLLPHSQRPTILQVASADSGVVVESSNAYGRKGFRLIIPAKTKATVAVRMAGAASPPSLLAWTEPALAAHNRQIAIYVAAVAGLIGAAAAIAGGLAVMTHHWAPRWAAASLTCMLLTRLSSLGMFDGSIVTSIGGPYGLTAMFGGLSLAAGIRFVKLVVPLLDKWPWTAKWLRWAEFGVVGLSVLAYIGIPGAVLLTDVLLFVVPPVIFGYLIYRSRTGSQPARVLEPAGGLFAMVSLITAFVALSGFGAVTPDLAGGFAAAGSVLLALAVTAGEGITVIPWRHHPVPAATPRPAPPSPPPPPKPVASAPPHAAIEAIGASHQGVFELNLVDESVNLSNEAGALIGLAQTRMAHEAWMRRIHPDDCPVYQQAIDEFRKQSGLAFRIEFRVRSEDGRYPWCELRATMKGPEGLPAERCVGLLADVTMRKEAEAEMMDRSVRDPLTGLGNRVALMEELENLGDELGSVLFAVLDIDRFKAIHASLGDHGGDEVLSRAAQRLVKSFNAVGHVFRIGGDGFALLVNAPSQSPDEFGATLVKVCQAPHQFGGRSVFAPVSVGIALGREARDPIDLLKNAELALVQAKRQGGDCARLYAPEMEHSAPADAVALEADLHRALASDEIEVFYQPIVRLSDRTVAGFEALLRWRHPSKGLVAPADFIAHSEETGIIVNLGQLALSRAAKDLAQWQRFFPLPEPLFVSVNLSRRQMHDPELINRLSELLNRGGLAPGSFKLEMTESTIATDGDARELAARIRSLGASLAIDDFGTGISSLSQLADLPFDTVKIDKSFLSRQGGTDSEDNGDVVLSSIVALAHDLKRNVIVEGVETEADAARVSELGCEFAQGFLFSEPITSHDALTYIARTFRAAEHQASGTTGIGGQA